MSTTAIIVQARMTSTRLPGKVLMDLAGHTVLAHVLARAAAIPGIDHVVCAVPDGAVHEPIAREAARAGAEVFRGSEDDVLSRYLGAARMVGCDVVMRVTSDCPLIDPAICRQVIDLVVEGGHDYACNNMPQSWPHGLDCEAFTTAALAQADREATETRQREHVTPWLREQPGLSRTNLPGPGGWAAEQRWTCDFPADLDFMRTLFQHLPALPAIPSTEEVLAVLRHHPAIAEINSGHHGVSRPTSPKENP